MLKGTAALTLPLGAAAPAAAAARLTLASGAAVLVALIIGTVIGYNQLEI